MATLRRLGPDVSLLAASLVAAAAVGRLFQGGSAERVFGPLLVSAAVGSAVPALMALKRVPLPARAVAGTVAVLLTGVWTAIGGATTSGLPTARTWHVAQTDLRGARPLLTHFTVPLPPVPGLVLLAALACGMVAMLASVLLHASDERDRVYPGLALLAPVGLLAFTCSQSTVADMTVLVVLFVAAGALTLTAARSPDADDVRRTMTPGRPSAATFAVTASAMAGVVFVALLVNAGAGGAGTSSAGVAPAVPLSAESLTSHLLAVEIHDANDVLFQANSPYRTYWQVAVLNVLRNGVWVPDAATEGAGRGIGSGADALSRAGGSEGHGRTFTSTVRIDALSSRILPVPPGTLALSGTTAALTGVGAVSSTPTTSGQQYTTLSAPPVTDPERGGNAPVASFPAALVRANTALPPLPVNVAALARSITFGAAGPLAQAELLVNWFRSGQFHYTLTPPASPPGTDPLVDFLTQSRSGSCEQFAGAFVVLARSLGLPSRVVVGFTAGRYSGPGEVTVRGADAHAWPQVYLGARAGWVSFEPTPEQPRGELAPEGVVGPSGVTTTTPTTSVSTPTTAPPAVPFRTPTTVPAPSGAHSATAGTASSGAGVAPVWWALIGLVVALTVILLLVIRRHRRRWSPSGRTPEELAALSQAEVDRALRRAGRERAQWQPLALSFVDLRVSGPSGSETEYARPGSAAADARRVSLVEDGVMVAEAANAALFDPLGISDERSRAAYQAALRLKRALPDLDRP
jgi:transglutaminase-like putative cysteine protease